MKLRHLILTLLIAVLTTAVMAQETETFTSDFIGNLIIQYPSDWNAYDDEREFMTVVARGEASLANELDSGQAALLFLTPQGLEAAGLPTNSADAAFTALLGEMPPEVVITDFVAEYGNGTQYDFNIPGGMSFHVVTFDRDNVPLIAIIGMNEPEEADVNALFDVIRTARYTDDAFDANSILLSQLMIDPSLGYTYEVPASWTLIDNSSYEIAGTFDIGTILLLTPETLEEPDPDAIVNFDTMIQSELELVADVMIEQADVVATDGEDINGNPTKEVVITLDEASEDGFILPFEYRFVLVDLGDNHMILSALYSESGESTESYLPLLRAIAETVYYAPIYPLPETVEHAGLIVSYPEGYTADTSAENQIVFESEDVTITLMTTEANIEAYGDVAGEDLGTFADAVAQELVEDDTITAQPVTIGRDLSARIFTNPLSNTIDTYVFVTDENGDNIMLMARHADETIFAEVRQTLEAMASQLTIAQE